MRSAIFIKSSFAIGVVSLVALCAALLQAEIAKAEGVVVADATTDGTVSAAALLEPAAAGSELLLMSPLTTTIAIAASIMLIVSFRFAYKR